jgi:hypothetical protein
MALHKRIEPKSPLQPYRIANRRRSVQILFQTKPKTTIAATPKPGIIIHINYPPLTPDVPSPSPSVLPVQPSLVIPYAMSASLLQSHCKLRIGSTYKSLPYFWPDLLPLHSSIAIPSPSLALALVNIVPFR